MTIIFILAAVRTCNLTTWRQTGRKLYESRALTRRSSHRSASVSTHVNEAAFRNG